MTNEKSILDEVEAYARQRLWRDLPEKLTYHSLHHTLDVVESTLEISRKQNLSRGDIEILQVAAWFHDLGYTKSPENHEELGAEMARQFLTEKKYPVSGITKVIGCIMATKMPQAPQNYLEQILCDADLMHLAGEDYFAKAALLHKELEHTKSCKISEHEWLKMNQDFLKKHCFFTDYAKNQYESGVKENLKKVRQRLKLWTKTEK